MATSSIVSMWLAELLPFLSALVAFIYGFRHFFKRGRSLYSQCITMAMGCHAIGTVYHIAQTLTLEEVLEGFTPAYLGRIGFFLFMLAANYGQMDRLVDDGTEAMRKYRYIALAAPAAVVLIFIPNLFAEGIPASTLISMALVWVPAAISLYYGLKHAIIPDMGFGFVKAIRPYNILSTCLGFSELLVLTAWSFLRDLQLVLSTALFGALCIASIIALRKGVEKWTV